MRNVLIASYDMEVGGVERSLAGMLDAFDYEQQSVDLMLYRHSGDFMELLSDRARLLDELPQYASFRQGIGELVKARQIPIALMRLLSKLHATVVGKLTGTTEPGYIQQQLMWKYTLPLLPALEQRYDVAISYLWPHYFVAEKVQAERKIAWIHTDYSTVETLHSLDLAMWNKFDAIIAVSEACRTSFLQKYESLAAKVFVIENILSPIHISNQARESIHDNPLLTDQRFKLLTVARLSHAKGIDQAVQAMKLLRDRGCDQLVWYVVGYGGDEAELRRLIEANGLERQFVLLGKQTNPYPYMLACDLYVQPSRYEGKAVTVTEAKALGKPVLITNYSTAASQVTHGLDGYIAELSAAGIADGIEKLYGDQALRDRLAAACRNTNYSNREELDKLYHLFEETRRRQAV
jgi:glycosyltransferase involved in cell wall biosynthesis